MFSLLILYLKLVGGVAIGWILGKILPPRVPKILGIFLFWIGVPVGILIFLRRADLSGGIWLSPLLAWLATCSGGILARTWVQIKTPHWQSESKGTFIFASMFGNTGYLGYPIILALVGEKYFGWALFYDLFCTTLGAYGLGGIFASFFSKHQAPKNVKNFFLTAIAQPIWWTFAVGLWFRTVSLPQPVEQILARIAWSIIALSLVLIGMRLSRLKSWQNWRSVSPTLIIKMILLPLVFGFVLRQFQIAEDVQFLLVLQSAMPPAFATLVISEAYDLDREIAVSAIAIGSTSLLVTLPLWMLLFGR